MSLFSLKPTAVLHLQASFDDAEGEFVQIGIEILLLATLNASQASYVPRNNPQRMPLTVIDNGSELFLQLELSIFHNLFAT